MVSGLLYCADMLRPRRADEHFAAEAQVARDLGGVVALIDHDALIRGETDRAVARVPRDLGEVWYRGWMIGAERYADLFRSLDDRGVRLMTEPAEYRAAHELPGWFDNFADLTPKSVWMPMSGSQVPSDEELAGLAAALPEGAAIIKDYVKSRKHEPDAFFIEDLADLAGFQAVVRRFIERQGSDLAGGIVLRSFEDFGGVDGPAAEARIWWVRGAPVVIGPHPDHAGAVVDPKLDEVAEAMGEFKSPFVTTDLVQRADGRWRLVEVGAGEVSDFPRGTEVEPLLRALLKR
ncbi:ATP-grasp domain-containing protein [Glycomyces buryatensis]|uniref:ATP-grasp domain-containing protein n=1 Tax=Glycomyces buryatensis TaxID=2570927 RepID=A0A4S8Q9N5_9ACTN|nr:ATP-grasp domain-containing protein [Glycomyces buryatensis]THV40161.1 hypothetical protein FAB82_15810 [Glycomyces buryatensis]